MREEGIPLTKYGIRIDSGDLAYLSKEAYKMLAAAGFDDAVISASSDLDEYLIESLKAQDAKINSWGVGTRLITANDNPAFGGVYKLAAVKDADSTEFTPKIKLSENTEKVTNPGNKTVYRLYNKKTGKIRQILSALLMKSLMQTRTWFSLIQSIPGKRQKFSAEPMKYANFSFLSSEKVNGSMNLHLLWNFANTARKTEYSLG